MSNEVKALNKETVSIYDTNDCMHLVKKMFPLIPKWVIRRVLYAEECYMKEVGIIDYEPSLDWWTWK